MPSRTAQDWLRPGVLFSPDIGRGQDGNADRYHRTAEPWIIEGLIKMYVAGWSTARRRPSGPAGGCGSVRPQGTEGEQDGGYEAADG